MDLLESILRTCQADKYYLNFKNNGIDAFTLKLLDEEDLKTIGIEDETLRKEIVKQVLNLQLPSESKTNIKVDRQYAYLVSNVISMQLNRHYANLGEIPLKKDEEIDLCDIILTPAVECLQECFISLEKKLPQLEAKLFKDEPKTNKSLVLASKIIATSVALIICCTAFSYLRK